MTERYSVLIDYGDCVRPLRHWPRPKTLPAYSVPQYFRTVRGAKAAASRELRIQRAGEAQVIDEETEALVCFKEGRFSEWKAADAA